MTAYSTTASGASVQGQFGLLAGSYTIKINKVVFYITTSFDGGATGWNRFSVVLRTGSSLSGGSAMSITPLRQGAPAATATARAGSITTSGTATTLQFLAVGGGGYGATTVEYAPPLDLTLRPGDVFSTDGLFDTTNNGANYGFTSYPTIYFEELRLNWAT